MIEIFIMVLLLIMSGLFSGSETALVALSIGRVESLLKEQRPGSVALYRLKKDPSRMLTTILIGNNVVNIALSVIATVISTKWLGDAGPGIAVGVLTLFILVFGEITPKSLATHYSERISLFVAPPLLLLMRVMFPLVWLLGQFAAWMHKQTSGERDPTVTESELISMLAHGVREGVIESDERELIERVFAFKDLKAKDVMTPQDRVFSLDDDLTVAEALPLVAEGTFSRIVLYHKTHKYPHKLVTLRDLLVAVNDGRNDVHLSEIGHDSLFVSEHQRIDELFALLRRKKMHLAIVVDEYGTERGIVTLEDLLEELVGEIYDESDRVPNGFSKVTNDEITVDGASELRVVEEFFDKNLPGKPTDKVSLWILTHTEKIPEQNQTFTIDGLQVTIEKVSRRRIHQVRIRRAPASEFSDESNGEIS